MRSIFLMVLFALWVFPDAAAAYSVCGDFRYWDSRLERASGSFLTGSPRSNAPARRESISLYDQDGSCRDKEASCAETDDDFLSVVYSDSVNGRYCFPDDIGGGEDIYLLTTYLMPRVLKSNRFLSVAILFVILSCANSQPGGQFLSYDLSNVDASEGGDWLVDVCRISGTFAHVAVVEVSGDPIDIAPQCPMPEVPNGYAEYPVATLETIAGSPASSMKLASGLISGPGFPFDTSTGDQFLVSLRQLKGLCLVAEVVPVDYQSSSFAARGSTKGPIDLPHKIADLKREVETQSRTPCAGNSFLWQDDATIQELWDEDDSYCENTGEFGEEDLGPGFWPGSGD